MPTREEVVRLYDRLKTWRAVGKRLKVSPAVAYRYAKELGWEPKRKDIRERLGLDELIVRKQAINRDRVTGRFKKKTHESEN